MGIKGITLIELLIAVAIVGILAIVTFASYEQYQDKVDNAQALADLQRIDQKISNFYSNNNRFPNSLNEVYATVPVDPWGNTYQYLNIITSVLYKENDNSMK